MWWFKDVAVPFMVQIHSLVWLTVCLSVFLLWFLILTCAMKIYYFRCGFSFSTHFSSPDLLRASVKRDFLDNTPYHPQPHPPLMNVQRPGKAIRSQKVVNGYRRWCFFCSCFLLWASNQHEGCCASGTRLMSYPCTHHHGGCVVGGSGEENCFYVSEIAKPRKTYDYGGRT